jgi:putative flippase GtrA
VSAVPARSLRREIQRFLIVGVVNTAWTAAMFYGLSLIFAASVAYTLVYAGGLAFLVMTTPRFVFGARPTAGRRAALAAWYLVVYLFGLVVIRFLGEVLELNRLGVTVGTVVVTSPVGFIGACLLVGRSPRQLGSGRTPSG